MRILRVFTRLVTKSVVSPEEVCIVQGTIPPESAMKVPVQPSTALCAIEFATSRGSIEQMQVLPKHYNTAVVENLAKHGSITCLRWLLLNVESIMSFDEFFKDDFETTSKNEVIDICFQLIIRTVARNGNLNVIRWLYNLPNFRRIGLLVELSIKYNQFGVVKFLVACSFSDHRPLFDKTYIQEFGIHNALHKSRFNIADWMFRQGIRPPESAIYRLAGFSIEALEWLYSHGCRPSEYDTCCIASREHAMFVIEWLRQKTGTCPCGGALHD